MGRHSSTSTHRMIHCNYFILPFIVSSSGLKYPTCARNIIMKTPFIQESIPVCLTYSCMFYDEFIVEEYLTNYNVHKDAKNGVF